MARKAKTRFTANIAGIERELFSVQEQQDGSLLLATAFPRYLEHPDGRKSSISEQHCSIHRTRNGAATTITHKTRLADGTSLSSVCYIPQTENYLLWPVYARRLPILEGDSRLAKTRPKDTAKVIAEFDYSKANLVYSVFVAKSDFDISSIAKTEITTHTAIYRDLQIIAIPAYINIPSINEGDIVGMTSSPPSVNNKRTEDHFQLKVNSIPPAEVANTHLLLMDLLREKLRERLSHLVSPTNPHRAMVDVLTSFTTTSPMAKKSVAE